MRDRLDLHKLFKELGIKNVYFQPPETLKMQYPCIRYKLNDISARHANDLPYQQTRAYEVTYIDEDPDNEMYEKISRLPMCRLYRQYVSDGLNCYVYTIYY